MRQIAHTILNLSLALLLVATSLLAASARGQTAVNGQVVILCSGGGLVQVSLDASGNPAGPAHLCPDLALGLLAALSLPPPEAFRPAGRSVTLKSVRQSHAIERAVPALWARGPPIGV
jgi:hypothetical protein